MTRASLSRPRRSLLLMEKQAAVLPPPGLASGDQRGHRGKAVSCVARSQAQRSQTVLSCLLACIFLILDVFCPL